MALRQVERENEEVQGEIAATRRAAYAAEEAVGRLEKEKLQQDLLVDSLQVGGVLGLGRRLLGRLGGACLPLRAPWCRVLEGMAAELHGASSLPGAPPLHRC